MSPNSRRRSARSFSVQIGFLLIGRTLSGLSKTTGPPPRSTAGSGLPTALSLAVVTALSAAVGVLIAREVGRGGEADGFFAAFGVFLVLVLAASAVRVAV